MKTGKSGIELLKELEGCSSKIRGANKLLSQVDIHANILVYPYYCSAKHLTIGWGCRIQNDKGDLIYGNDFTNGVSVLSCEQMFKERLERDFEIYVNKWLKTEVNQNQFDALICLCFNRPVWAKKVIEDLINVGEKDNIVKISNLWHSLCTVGGITHKGILSRRNRETKLYFSL